MPAKVYHLQQKDNIKRLPLEIITTGIGGAVLGFLIQQNKGTLEEISYLSSPSGQLTAAAFANLGFYAVKDLSFMTTKGKPSGSWKNLESDIKYFSIFNAAGSAGYLLGVAKDYLMY